MNNSWGKETQRPVPQYDFLQVGKGMSEYGMAYNVLENTVG